MIAFVPKYGRLGGRSIITTAKIYPEDTVSSENDAPPANGQENGAELMRRILALTAVTSVAVLGYSLLELRALWRDFTRR